MKNLFLSASVAALFSFSSAFASIQCDKVPTCADLGYDTAVSECPANAVGNSMVIKCPIDTARGKCVYEAAPGQIAYFPVKPSTKSGWLLCNGASVSRTQYPELASALKQTASTFTLPDYQGYFLRVYASYTSAVNSQFQNFGGTINTSLVSAQSQQLPNLEGYFGMNGSTYGDNNITNLKNLGYKLFEQKNGGYPGKTNIDCVAGGGRASNVVEFDAGNYNPIYKDNADVSPGHFYAFVYIYAGKCVGSDCYK